MGVELPEWINRRTVERAYSRARDMQRQGQIGLRDRGFRAARARDPKLLKALEGMAEVLDKVAEEQSGRTRRAPDAPLSQRVDPTEIQLVRNAYEVADGGMDGEALKPYAWIYGCAAELAGIL